MVQKKTHPINNALFDLHMLQCNVMIALLHLALPY